MTYKFTGDFKAKFSAEVTKLIEANKGYPPRIERKERMKIVNRLLNDYIEQTGEAPEQSELERLTDVILAEEIRDPHPDKMTTEEYPVMSDYQLARRQFGAHKEKTDNARIEVPLHEQYSIGTDGRNYRYPTRRLRTIDEMIYMDEATKSRNKERRRCYNEFRYGKMTKDGRVFSPGVFSVNVQTGETIIHDPDKYCEMFPWAQI